MSVLVLTEQQRERYWAKVSIPVEWDDDACWLWVGARNSDGYGVFGVGGRRLAYAHRLQLAMSGLDPTGLEARHLCATPACVRPDHLAVGTRAQNIADTVRHGHVRRGANHPATRLSEADVRGIKACVDGHQATADRLGISRTAVWQIRHGKTWRHVDLDW